MTLPGLEINQSFPVSWRHSPSTSEWLPKVYGRFSPSPSDYLIQTKMAAAEVIRWSTVVGEYGVLLTEMGSMEDLQTPIKPYPRIKVCGVMLYNRIYLFAWDFTWNHGNEIADHIYHSLKFCLENLFPYYACL